MGQAAHGRAADALSSLAGQVTDAVEEAVKPEARLAGRIARAQHNYRKGQRVQGVDSYGVTRMGTVNGAGWGAVSNMNHPNYGRTWVDVDWDEAPGSMGTGRSRLFTSDLIKY
mgnify:FL=1